MESFTEKIEETLFCKITGKLFYVSLFLTLLITSPMKGQKFDGKVESFAFDVKATPAGGAISLKPPKAVIKNSDSKVDYTKTDSILVVPPITNQVMAAVESLHSKLDVKGQYAKWNPKIITKKIKIHRLLFPKLIPLQLARPNMAQVARVNAIRRGTPTALSHSLSHALHRSSLFQHRAGHILNAIKIVPIQKLEHIYTNRKYFRNISREKTGRNFATNKRGLVVRNSEEHPSLSGRRIERREISEKDDLSKSIEALIAESLKSRKMNNDTGDSFKERKGTESQKHSRMSQRRKIINEKIKELGSPEVKRYMDSIASKVNHVVSEAKGVLQDTGRIVRGIRKVISGARLLTDFTKNAVKFAKYFAMEPNNATVDFFEEKAVMAVLEAQKAAAEAKISAVESRNSAKRIKDLMHKLERKADRRSSKKMSKLSKYVENESHRAEKLAKLTSNQEKEARKKAVIVDKALRKMIDLANKEVRENEYRSNKDSKKNEESQKEKEESAGDKVEKENDKAELNKDASEEEDIGVNKQEYEHVEKLKTEERQESWNKVPSVKSMKNLGKDEEEGSGTETNKHNQTEDTESKNADTNNNRNNKTEGIEASELPDMFHGGGDENEVVTNDFEQEGFSIPETENKHNEAEAEISSVLDTLADYKATQNKNLQQLLKMGNETDQYANSSVKVQERNGQKTVQNETNEDVNDKPIDFHSENEEIKQKHVSKEDDRSDKDGSEEPSPSHSARIKGLPKPTGIRNVLKHSKAKPTPAKTAQSNVIERKVEKIEKGPIKLVVTVTRRKTSHKNKTSGSGEKKEEMSSSEGKRVGVTDDSLFDPFNFSTLEAQQHQNMNKVRYIVDKEDEGRAGLTPSYNIPKEKTARSSLSRIHTTQNDGSEIYDYKPTDIVTQI